MVCCWCEDCVLLVEGLGCVVGVRTGLCCGCKDWVVGVRTGLCCGCKDWVVLWV